MIKQGIVCIPKDVWHNRQASWMCKILFSEILRNSPTKSNYKVDFDYLVKFMNMDVESIKIILQELVNLKWIVMFTDNSNVIQVKTLYAFGFVEYKEGKSKAKKSGQNTAEPDNGNETQMKEMIEVYNQWHIDYLKYKPKFNPGDFVAMKSIITYLDTIRGNHSAVDIFKAMLSGWDKLDNYLKNKTRITDINLNFNNIVNQLKNAKSKQKGHSKLDEYAKTI